MESKVGSDGQSGGFYSEIDGLKIDYLVQNQGERHSKQTATQGVIKVKVWT